MAILIARVANLIAIIYGPFMAILIAIMAFVHCHFWPLVSPFLLPLWPILVAILAILIAILAH